MLHLPSPDSLDRAVARALQSLHAPAPRFEAARVEALPRVARSLGHNVGGLGRFGFAGDQLAMRHNVGQGSAVPLPGGGGDRNPGVPQDVWDLLRRAAARLRCSPCDLLGGSPAFGYGGGCAAPSPPPIPRNEDGCPAGWTQCKQPLGAVALAVAAGATVPITVTPRRVVTPYQLIVTAAAGLAFALTSVRIDGIEYLGQDNVTISCAAYQPDQPDHSINWADFSSTTPLVLTVQNVSAAAADFRAVINAYSLRG